MATQYCSSDEVQEEFKSLTFGTGTSVTSDRVDRFIEEASAYINSKIGLVYTTPVVEADSPESWMVLRMICIMLVVKRLKPILSVRAPTEKDSQESEGEDDVGGAEKMLKDIIDQKLLLTDAPKISSSGVVNSYSRTNGLEHTMKKGEDQW